MVVNRKSWHCRMLLCGGATGDRIRWNKQVSLCRYFWAVAGRILLLALVSAFGLGYVILGIFVKWQIFIPLICVVVLLVIAAGGLWTFQIVRDATRESDNLAVRFVRAAKRRVCPILTFRD